MTIEPTEQSAIGEILSDADALIDSLEQLLAKKRDIRKGVIQGLLSGVLRLRGFASAWTHVALGDLFGFKNGLNKGKSFFGSGTPIVNYMDVFNSPVIRSARLTGRVALSGEELSRFDVRKGDVVFTRTSETREDVELPRS